VPRPFRGRFIIRTQGGSALYVCTKFQADSYFPSKVMGTKHVLIYIPYAGRLCPPSLYEIWSWLLNSSKCY